MATTKMKCNCGNHSQDFFHGEGVRVWNKTEKKSGDQAVYRCTVCGKEQSQDKKGGK